MEGSFQWQLAADLDKIFSYTFDGLSTANCYCQLLKIILCFLVLSIQFYKPIVYFGINRVFLFKVVDHCISNGVIGFGK